MSLSQLIIDIKTRARENNIKVILSPWKYVIDEFEGKRFKCRGYFSDTEKVIKVATNRKMTDWIPTLIHESCHLDQKIEDREFYDKLSVGYDKFNGWYAGDREVDESIVRNWAMDIIALELDCERRTVQKIKDYNLGFNIPNYIRTANSYLFHYLFSADNPDYLEKYSSDVKNLSDHSSSKFKSDYSKIPRRLHQAFVRHLRASK
jgi:hypothetical protein